MKKIFLALSFIAFSIIPCYAEKIPVRIAPLQHVSTEHDEVEVGDWIAFQNIQDVYLGDKLYLKKGAHVNAIVDFVSPNGWGADDAEVKFKTFNAVDADNKKIEINYPLTLKKESSDAKTVRDEVSYYGLRLIRGAEVDVEPDTKIFNIFMER